MKSLAAAAALAVAFAATVSPAFAARTSYVYDDAQLREALRIARDTIGLILEPSGALGIAAALQHRNPDRKPAAIVTGSNFSDGLLAELTTESSQRG